MCAGGLPRLPLFLAPGELGDTVWGAWRAEVAAGGGLADCSLFAAARCPMPAPGSTELCASLLPLRRLAGALARLLAPAGVLGEGRSARGGLGRGLARRRATRAPSTPLVLPLVLPLPTPATLVSAAFVAARCSPCLGVTFEAPCALAGRTPGTCLPVDADL